MTTKQLFKIVDRIKCPYCGYMMRILKKNDNKYICYCASCRKDIWVDNNE